MTAEDRPMRVCVCTSTRADAEPRAPRHAMALTRAGLNVEITLFDCAPAGDGHCRLKKLNELPNLARVTHHYYHRKKGPLMLACCRVWQKVARALFRLFKIVVPGSISPYILGVQRKLRAMHADVYIAHNIEMLLPAAQAARTTGAKFIFDCMEFYSDMGGAQTELDRRIIEKLEGEWLPKVELVLASSRQVADEYVSKYCIRRPLVLYNVPEVEDELPEKDPEEFRLYWRNAVIDLGQRGLDDALVALQSLPVGIVLHIQGRLPADRRPIINARIQELGVSERVFIHPPFCPEDAVREAARHTVGLCLEQRGNRNQECTVSNKIFDYMMAELAVIASDLPGLSEVIDCSKGGVVYRSGDPDDLARKISVLYYDACLRQRLARNGRKYALATGNRSQQMRAFTEAFCRLTDIAGKRGLERTASHGENRIGVLQ